MFSQTRRHSFTKCPIVLWMIVVHVHLNYCKAFDAPLNSFVFQTVELRVTCESICPFCLSFHSIDIHCLRFFAYCRSLNAITYTSINECIQNFIWSTFYIVLFNSSEGFILVLNRTITGYFYCAISRIAKEILVCFFFWKVVYVFACIERV